MINSPLMWDFLNCTTFFNCYECALQCAESKVLFATRQRGAGDRN